MRNVLVFVLGGGRGTRLYPLTKYRSKPAVPLAGKYRIIDIPISNCINSGLNHIYVLTQYHSVSIHRHIRRTYTFSPFDGGFVEILAAQQTLQSEDWYQGTADAVRQNLQYLKQPGIDYVLILSGDQLYRMNYADLLENHRRTGADATIAAVPVARDAASALGIMRLDDSGRVVGFVEKPKTDEALAPALTDPAWIDAQGIPSRGRECLANMGIYLFNRDTLVEMLESTDYEDFGKQIFPRSIDTYRVQVHLFDGYWEDIGTVQAFYQANLDLAAPNPPFELGSAVAPIYSRPRFLPPSRIGAATVRGSLVADGCVIDDGAVIENSVIGLRCRIGRDVTIRDSVVMGADYYEDPQSIAAARARGEPMIGIGTGTRVEGAIIDKNCRIGENVRVLNESGVESADETAQCMICDGIVVIPKASVLPDDWTV
jgi:glucose-1-phosphate adenylyltransferase